MAVLDDRAVFEEALQISSTEYGGLTTNEIEKTSIFLSVYFCLSLVTIRPIIVELSLI